MSMDYQAAAREFREKGYSAIGGLLYDPTGRPLGNLVRGSGGLYETVRLAWQLTVLEHEGTRTRDLRGKTFTTTPVTNRFK